jgi:hypothetical protein
MTAVNNTECQLSGVEMEAMMRVERETEWAAQLTDQERMTEMFQYMQSLDAA